MLYDSTYVIAHWLLFLRGIHRYFRIFVTARQGYSS